MLLTLFSVSIAMLQTGEWRAPYPIMSLDISTGTILPKETVVQSVYGWTTNVSELEAQ
jgi:hypothetical protein